MTTLPLVDDLLARPILLVMVLLLVTPGVHILLSIAVERRPVGWTDDYPAVLIGDPALAVAAGLGAWLADGELAFLADWRWGLGAMAGGGAYGWVQSRAELVEGRYSIEQIRSPSKRFHQYVVYPVLGHLVPVAMVSGVQRWSDGPGVAVTMLALWVLWAVLVVQAIRHPRLGHGTSPPTSPAALRAAQANRLAG